jgi:hypothetical protein
MGAPYKATIEVRCGSSQSSQAVPLPWPITPMLGGLESLAARMHPIKKKSFNL